MAVTVKDLLSLEIMKDFKMVAGEEGLNATINATEILDFEFLEEIEGFREKEFDGNSIVLSSLLFAKDNPELILKSIKKLVNLNVRALAYKPVFFKELPQEAIIFANQRRFPILEFGKDEFFEKVIFSVGKLIEKDNNVWVAETLIADMLEREFSKEEAAAAHEEINPFLRPEIMVYCIKEKGFDENKILDNIKRAHPSEKLISKVFVGKYKDMYVIILSQDEANPGRFSTLLEDVLITYNLAGTEMMAGHSGIKALNEGFDQSVRKAYWAARVAEIEKENVKDYEDLGIYKLIVSQIHSKGTIGYMQDYLAPLFEETEKDGELLRTAIEYILAKGDALKAAERMYCHKNTIRYRIGKLQEKLDPRLGEKEFYQNLAVAVKIYLLIKD